jgi:hypothetical protein
MTGKRILGTILTLAVLGCTPPAPVVSGRLAGLVGTKVDRLPADWGPATRTVSMPDGNVTYVWDIQPTEDMLEAAAARELREHPFYTGLQHAPKEAMNCLWIVEADPAGVIVKVGHQGTGCE